MKNTKRFISILLAVILIFCMLPVNVFGADTDTFSVFFSASSAAASPVDWYADEACTVPINEKIDLPRDGREYTYYFKPQKGYYVQDGLKYCVIDTDGRYNYGSGYVKDMIDGSSSITFAKNIYSDVYSVILKCPSYLMEAQDYSSLQIFVEDLAHSATAMTVADKPHFFDGKNIYFGEYDYNDDKVDEVVKWNVLGEGTAGEDSLLLLSDGILEFEVPFDENSFIGEEEQPYTADNSWNTWTNARAWCDTFETDSLTKNELAAVKKVTLNDAEYTTEEITDGDNVLQEQSRFDAFGNYENEQVFFLSAKEVETYLPYLSSRIASNSKYDWWLRSKNTYDNTDRIFDDWGDYIYYVGLISVASNTYDAYNGRIYLTDPSNNYESGYRPAFNLDTSKILLVTAASQNAAPNFAATSTYDGNDWVLTLADSKTFNATGYVGETEFTEGYDASQLTINHYSLDNSLYHATAESIYNQVTATISDSNSNILYYGRINSNTSATSTTMTIPAGLSAGNYTLSIRGEYWPNKPNSTRIATGTAYEIPITVKDAAGYKVTEKEPAIQYGTAAITGYTTDYGYDRIAYGSNKQDWRVLDTAANTGEECIFLLSEKVLASNVAFNTNGSTYSGSDADAWAASFATTDNFSSYEVSAMLQTTKDDDANSFSLSENNYTVVAEEKALNSDKMFMLSYAEATSAKYGLENSSKRKADYAYWLRSTIDSSKLSWPLSLLSMAVLVGGDGIVSPANANNSNTSDGQNVTYFGYRPATNINTSKVLFTLAADGTAEENFGKIEDVINRNWKFTLKTGDTFETTLNRTEVAAGESITVSYSTFSSTYDTVTAMLLKGNTPVAYGKLEDLGNSQSRLTIPQDLEAGEYGLRIYAEKWNEGTSNFAAESADTKTITVSEEPLYSVSYNVGDGSGTVTDSERYLSGEIATVLSNAGVTPPKDRVFLEWNTAADGSDTSYKAGDTITVTQDVTLYAQWLYFEMNVGDSGSFLTDTNSWTERYREQGEELTPRDFKLEVYCSKEITKAEYFIKEYAKGEKIYSSAEDIPATTQWTDVTQEVKDGTAVATSNQDGCFRIYFRATAGGVTKVISSIFIMSYVRPVHKVSKVFRSGTGDVSVTYDMLNLDARYLMNGNIGLSSANYTIDNDTDTVTFKSEFLDTLTVDNTYSYTVYYKLNGHSLSYAATTISLTPCDETPVEITGITAATGLAYNGQPQAGYTGTPTNAEGYTGEYTVTYSGRNTTVYDSTTPPTEVGDYTVTVSVPAENADYVGSKALDFSIAKATFAAEVTQDGALTYSGMPQTAAVKTTESGLQGEQTVTYKYGLSENDCTADTVPAFTDVDTYTVYFVANAANHNEAKGSFEVTVDRKEIGIQWAAPVNLIYDGTAKLPTAAATGLVGSETANIQIELNNGDNINAGTFTFKATGIDNSNYKLPDEAISPVYTILPKTITAIVTVAESVDYDGTEKTPEVKVYDGDTLIPDTEYEVVYSNNIEAGTAAATVIDKDGGNYVVTGNASFEIIRAPQDITVIIPIEKTVLKGGTEEPTAQVFEFELLDLEGNPLDSEALAEMTIANTLETNGVGVTAGTVTVTADPEAYAYYLSDGFMLREVNGGAEGWTYSDTMYYAIWRETEAEIYLVDNSGQMAEEPVEMASFTNIYTKNAEAQDPPSQSGQEPETPEGEAPESEETGENEDTPEQEVISKQEETPEPKENVEETAEPEEAEEKPETADPAKAPQAEKSPKTQDNGNLILWVALFFVSGMGVIKTTKSQRKI